MKIRNNTQEIKVPRTFVVYYLTDNDGEVLYVGKSNGAMFNRLASHSYLKNFERVFYVICNSQEEMEKLEVEEIIKYRPTYNKILEKPSLAGYMNTKELKQEIKKRGRKMYGIMKLIEENKVRKITLGVGVYYHKEILNIL